MAAAVGDHYRLRDRDLHLPTDRSECSAWAWFVIRGPTRGRLVWRLWFVQTKLDLSLLLLASTRRQISTISTGRKVYATPGHSKCRTEFNFYSAFPFLSILDNWWTSQMQGYYWTKVKRVGVCSCHLSKKPTRLRMVQGPVVLTSSARHHRVVSS